LLKPIKCAINIRSIKLKWCRFKYIRL